MECNATQSRTPLTFCIGGVWCLWWCLNVYLVICLRGCLRHVCSSHSKNKNSANESATEPELLCSLCSLERHNRGHSENNTESFECEHCDKKYTRNDNLLKHEQRIHGFYKIDFERAASFSSINNMFKCPLCLASFDKEKERHCLQRLP